MRQVPSEFCEIPDFAVDEDEPYLADAAKVSTPGGLREDTEECGKVHSAHSIFQVVHSCFAESILVHVAFYYVLRLQIDTACIQQSSGASTGMRYAEMMLQETLTMTRRAGRASERSPQSTPRRCAVPGCPVRGLVVQRHSTTACCSEDRQGMST
jgi:hypothetical protein